LEKNKPKQGRGGPSITRMGLGVIRRGGKYRLGEATKVGVAMKLGKGCSI